MTTAIILDTETTRIENPEVIELAYCSYDFAAPGVPTVKRFRPSMPCEYGALAVHHILPSELEDCPPAAQAPAAVPQADYWIGHNIDFDWKALGQPPVKRICTLALARHIWPEVDSHSQSALIYFLFGAIPATRERLRNAHSAEADIALTLSILDSIVGLEGIEDFAELHRLSEHARVPTKFTFGKFRGMPISAADRGYANWYARQPDPDPYMLEAFRRARLL